MRLAHLLVVFALLTPSFAAEEKKAPPSASKLKHYIYVLKLVPRLHRDEAWTDDDRKTVATHFAHLKAATTDGKVIHAGRTLTSGSRTFGLVLFEAADEDAARKFMLSDPAVTGKVMTAELHPYQVAIERPPKPRPDLNVQRNR